MKMKRFFIGAGWAIPVFLMTNLSQIHSQIKTVEWPQQLFEQHEKFREPALAHRRFKHRDLEPLIKALPFEKKVAGQSSEKRDIHLISLGDGEKTVLLWSQMHGDEPTATMAIFDLFHFFKAKNDGFDAIRQRILTNCRLHFVPMLNPDGAEKFQRHTSGGIDMNRDALRLQTPEGRLLKRLQNELKPAFAFNLHDQDRLYSAGNSPRQATISFLATAFDRERTWNNVRLRSAQVICHMNDVLQAFIPGRVARYSDEFEPRAFGDNIQKWGSSLILIESGGYPGDPENQQTRRLNFLAILAALDAISTGELEKQPLENYQNLPVNDRKLFDLLIRNARFIENGDTLTKDIGINFDEKNLDNATRFEVKSKVRDLGDLSVFWGIDEMDARGLTVRFPKNFPAETAQIGLTTRQMQTEKLGRNDEATFILASDDGQVLHFIVNGTVIPSGDFREK